MGTVNIPLYLSYASVAQCTKASHFALNEYYKGRQLAPNYIGLLRILRETISWKYNLIPSDPALDQVANFMFTLSGGQNTTPIIPAIPLFIVTQPQSQTVNSGSNVTFSVTAGGGVPGYTYQWYFNNVAIGGATNQSLVLNSVTGANAGNYKVVVTDSVGATVTSNVATLTVNTAAITGSFYYGGTDYFTALSGGTDNITYQGTFSITHNAPISVPYPLAAANNMFLVIRVPIGESLKTTWFNTALNNGTIQPSDGIFRAPLQPVGLPLYTYYLTELQVSNDFSQPLILS